MLDNNYLQRWFLIVFALSCVGINVVAYILYEKSQRIYDSKQWVSHTYQVMTQEYKLFALLQDMQTTQRTFIITGNDIFLVPYRNARAEIFKTVDALKQLVRDNPEQEHNIMENAKIVSKLMTLVETQIRTRKEIDFSINDIDFTKNKDLVDQIRIRHDEIVENEEKLLNLRRGEERHRQKNYMTTLFSTAALSAIGLLLANAAVAFLTYRRKTAEDDLRKINAEMEGFTYIASHDLRSPLVNLKGFATEMKYSVDDLQPILEKNKEAFSEEDSRKIREIVDQDIPDALRYIHSSVEKMDKLTNAILELSRLGRRTIDFKPVETSHVVKHILDTLHHTITSKNITVTILPLPDVVADQLSLEQVFGNILDNAVKYMDPSRLGKIEIGGVRNYRETKFWVRDNGRGIAEGDFQKIFEIYRRAGNSENIPGEGMGMAYVRTTLRRLGGQIWCESKPGAGTTFYFTISNSLKKDKKK